MGVLLSDRMRFVKAVLVTYSNAYYVIYQHLNLKGNKMQTHLSFCSMSRNKIINKKYLL